MYRFSPQPAFAVALFTFLLGLGESGCVSAQRADSPVSGAATGGAIRLPQADSDAIGRKIWQNECSGTVEGLVSWNSGEDFASLGIGHFIWYVSGRPGPFEESFPKLIAYMKQRNVAMPSWLAAARGCPWPNREAFLAQQGSPQMKELRQFLAATVPVQTDFIVLRLEQALPKMAGATPNAGDRERLKANFYRVAQSRQGVYALIDYVNFKGEGVKPEERYNGLGWGLRDVLLTMRDTPGGTASAHEFGEAAKIVLRRRVDNSPPARSESRWLPGWLNRCGTYQRPL
ncbi:MAG: hypothetical protein KDL87_09785 [Verrucomicrobiae bacterium]|nr:hypothetical protein [Verrucomicrobiae bacterium]